MRKQDLPRRKLLQVIARNDFVGCISHHHLAEVECGVSRSDGDVADPQNRARAIESWAIFCDGNDR